MKSSTVFKLCMKLPCTRRGRRVIINGVFIFLSVLFVSCLLFQNGIYSFGGQLNERHTHKRYKLISNNIEESADTEKLNRLFKQNQKSVQYRKRNQNTVSGYNIYWMKERDNSQRNPNIHKRRIQSCNAKPNTKATCTILPPKSDKTFNVSFEEHSFKYLNNLHGDDLYPGGHFRPASCQTDQKTAILIPYRDRGRHLKMLLNNLHPFLKKQNIEYTIFIVEQLPGSKFNRGMIKNIGFVEAMKLCNYTCIFFHDIDMVPDDYGNYYRCGEYPMQHSRDLARWKHKKPYIGSFGGVVSFRSEQFKLVNGYTNTYFEWGLEDDEMGSRIRLHKMPIAVKAFHLGSYQEFPHTKSKQYRRSWKWVKQWRSRAEKDGINSLVYKLEKINFNPLYTHLYIDISLEAVKRAYNGSIMVAGSSDELMP